MLDIDDFKIINDTHGHAIGDQVIKHCANVLKTELNSNNCVAGRYGGEEFLLIKLRLTKEEAYGIAEHIRVTINETVYEQMGLNVTVSVGVYHMVKPTNLSLEELVHEADINLYEAKKAGKNQVIVSSNI